MSVWSNRDRLCVSPLGLHGCDHGATEGGGSSSAVVVVVVRGRRGVGGRREGNEATLKCATREATVNRRGRLTYLRLFGLTPPDGAPCPAGDGRNKILGIYFFVCSYFLCLLFPALITSDKSGGDNRRQACQFYIDGAHILANSLRGIFGCAAFNVQQILVTAKSCFLALFEVLLWPTTPLF